MAAPSCLRAARQLKKHIGALVEVDTNGATPNHGLRGTLVKVGSARAVIKTLGARGGYIEFAAWNLKVVTESR